jgi:hypothetical protein
MCKSTHVQAMRPTQSRLDTLHSLSTSCCLDCSQHSLSVPISRIFPTQPICTHVKTILNTAYLYPCQDYSQHSLSVLMSRLFSTQPICTHVKTILDTAFLYSCQDYSQHSLSVPTPPACLDSSLYVPYPLSRVIPPVNKLPLHE